MEKQNYLSILAPQRLNKSFKETHAMFENYAQKEEDLSKETVSVCLWDQIHEDMIEEYEQRLAKQGVELRFYPYFFMYTTLQQKSSPLYNTHA